MKTTTLLATAFISLLVAGQTAMAGEEAPRDEYSIGLTWSTESGDSMERVNYSIQGNTEDSSLIKALFPDNEQ